jgi:hypothetical protein
MMKQNRYFLILIAFLFLFSSCDHLRKSRVHRAFRNVIKEQVQKEVINIEKKSENPDTWPKNNKIVVDEDYSLAKFRYHANALSQIMLKRQDNRWVKVFSADLISYPTFRFSERSKSN